MKKVAKTMGIVIAVVALAFVGIVIMHMRTTSEISKASFVSGRYGRTRHERIKGYSEWCSTMLHREDFNEIKAISMYNADGSVKGYAFCKERENGRRVLIAFVRYDQFMDWMNSVEDHLYDKVHEVAIPVADWMGIF